MDHFLFIDEVTELKKNESVTAFFKLKGSEEFLSDHFPGFPVMPGVLLLETLKQAAVRMLPDGNYRLKDVKNVKFGQFVKPGAELQVQAQLVSREKDSFLCRGEIQTSGKRALSAEITLAA